MENQKQHDILSEDCACLKNMPFNVVLKQWLNEAVRASNAYDFIREKGLLGEFLCEHKSTECVNNVHLRYTDV